MILADKIVENRKKNGWSQEELAEKLGVTRQSVSKWESATAVYLIWSFTTMRWEFTWIVWPVGGVLFVVYREIMKAIVRSR